MDNVNMENNASKSFGYWNDRNHLQEEKQESTRTLAVG